MEHDNIIHFNPNAENPGEDLDVAVELDFLEDALDAERCLPMAEAEKDAETIVLDLLRMFSMATMTVHYLEQLKAGTLSNRNRRLTDAMFEKADFMRNGSIDMFVGYMLQASGGGGTESTANLPSLAQMRSAAKILPSQIENFSDEVETYLEKIGSSVEQIEIAFNDETDEPSHIGILMTEAACMDGDMCDAKNGLEALLKDKKMREQHTYYGLVMAQLSIGHLKLMMEDIMAAIFAGGLLASSKQVDNDVLSEYCDHMYELIENGQDLLNDISGDGDNDDDEDEED